MPKLSPAKRAWVTRRRNARNATARAIAERKTAESLTVAGRPQMVDIWNNPQLRDRVNGHLAQLNSQDDGRGVLASVTPVVLHLTRHQAEFLRAMLEHTAARFSRNDFEHAAIIYAQTTDLLNTVTAQNPRRTLAA